MHTHVLTADYIIGLHNTVRIMQLPGIARE